MTLGPIYLHKSPFYNTLNIGFSICKISLKYLLYIDILHLGRQKVWEQIDIANIMYLWTKNWNDFSDYKLGYTLNIWSHNTQDEPQKCYSPVISYTKVICKYCVEEIPQTNLFRVLNISFNIVWSVQLLKIFFMSNNVCQIIEIWFRFKMHRECPNPKLKIPFQLFI